MAVAARLQPIDRWTLGYVAFAAALLVLRYPAGLPYAGLLPAALALVALTAGMLAPRARGAGPVGALLGEFYPLILTAALYTQIGLVNAAAGVCHDAIVQGWEEALFGGQPSRDWIRASPSPTLSRLLHAGYLSYYVVVAAAPLGLWLSGRRGPARQALLRIMAAFYVCYAAFLVFPVAGPRYAFALADNAATRVELAVFTQTLLDSGAAWGTAFPSSHVAASLTAALSALGSWRALGRPLLAASVLLALATVYGQFHYAVDSLAGALVAAAVLLAPLGRTRDGVS
jgi:membrane-associated phospholipid phosphatase